MLDISTRVIIKSKTPEKAKELIENMASNDFDVQNERTQVQKKGVLELQTHVCSGTTTCRFLHPS